MKKKVFCLVLLAVLVLSATSAFAANLSWVAVSPSGGWHCSLVTKTNYLNYASVTCQAYNSPDYGFYVAVMNSAGTKVVSKNLVPMCEYSSVTVKYDESYGSNGTDYRLYTKGFVDGGMARIVEFIP